MNQMPPDDMMHLLPASDSGRIPAEVVAQQTVYCLDQEVLLVLTDVRICYVSLPNSCAVLGLNTRGQLQRIQRTPQIFAGLRQLSVHTRGGGQRVNCLQMECILEWLSGINSRTA